MQEELCKRRCYNCDRKEEIRLRFSDEQIIAILKSNNRAADIAMLLISTGCRPIDLFTAELKNRYDTYFISGSKTEAGRDRVIPVNEIGQRSYNKIKRSAKSNGDSLLIDGYSGNKRYKNFAKRDWKELMEELKIGGVVPYDCRHTYTTLAVQSGVKPEILQKILGHADYSTTIGVYTHLDLKDILEESKKVTVTDRLQTQENKVKETRLESSEKQ